MRTNICNFAIGAVVVTFVITAVAYSLTRRDDCLDKARAFVSNAPSITDKTGKVTSVGTSPWLSGQAASRVGERTFYFLLKGERATANAIVSADRATCTCRLESIK